MEVPGEVLDRTDVSANNGRGVVAIWLVWNGNPVLGVFD
jgi:hypothetical protein